MKSWSRVPTASTTSASGGEVVGRGRPDDAERAAVEPVVVRHERPAGDGLDDRDAVRLGEGERLGGSSGVAHASTEDEQGALCGAQGLGGADQVVPVGALPRNPVHAGLEHREREVELLDLCVLRHREHDRPAVGGIGEHAGHLGQRREQLLRVG